MKPIVYDASVLIRADRNQRGVWAHHRVRLEAGLPPLIPSPVVAQVSRSPRQASLRRFLRGCEVASFGESDAHRAGALLGKSRTSDVVDACVVALAIERRADISSDDREDMLRLLGGRANVAVVVP